jgi:integrase
VDCPVWSGHDLHALSLLFQYAMKHSWCQRNPVRDVEIPSDADAQRSYVLSPAEEVRYFAAIDALIMEKTAGKRTKEVRALNDIRDLSVLMLNQGCRPEELRELLQENVDLRRGMLTIQRGKSKAARRVLPVTAASRDVLARRLQTPGLWVFPSQKYPDRHIGQAQRLWAAVTKRAGLNMVMYDLRHTFATRAVERGVELPKLMAILGHANLRSIMRYVHITAAHIEDGMRKFEEGAGPVVDVPMMAESIQ